MAIQDEDEAQWRKAEMRLRKALTEFAHAARSTYQGQLFAQDALEGLRLIDLARERYDAVVTNPPFGSLSRGAKRYLTETYSQSKNDLLSIFVDRAITLLKPSGLLGVITSRTCFFAVSFSSWRKEVVLANTSIAIIADLGHGVMDDAMVEAAAYVLERKLTHSRTTVIRAIADANRETAVQHCATAYRTGSDDARLFYTDDEDFAMLSGPPFVYWVTPDILKKLASLPRFEPTAAQVRKGLRTGDNFRFLRAFWALTSDDLTSDICADDHPEPD